MKNSSWLCCRLCYVKYLSTSAPHLKIGILNRIILVTTQGKSDTVICSTTIRLRLQKNNLYFA